MRDLDFPRGHEVLLTWDRLPDQRSPNKNRATHADPGRNPSPAKCRISIVECSFHPILRATASEIELEPQPEHVGALLEAARAVLDRLAEIAVQPETCTSLNIHSSTSSGRVPS